MTQLTMGEAATKGPVEALRAEFGAVLAARILEAEEVDFLWDGRVAERYLGQHLQDDIQYDDDDATELLRVAIVSVLDGEWYAAVCLADGDGEAVALLWQRVFERRDEARAAYERAA